jgi:hypothetical protein
LCVCALLYKHLCVHACFARALRLRCASFARALRVLCVCLCLCVFSYVCLCERACVCVWVSVYACVSASVCVRLCLLRRACVCVRAHVMDWSMMQRASETVNAPCSSTGARRRVRPAQRIRARQRQRHELPVGNGPRAGSSRMPDSGGHGGGAVRRRCRSRWSAGGVRLAHSRRRKLLLQQCSRPKQRLRAARVRRCA